MLKMEIFIRCQESSTFKQERLALNYKQSNFTYKRLRTLSIMLSEGSNVSHLIAVENLPNFFLQKIYKDLFVIISIKNDELINGINLIFHTLITDLIMIKSFETASIESKLYDVDLKKFWSE